MICWQIQAEKNDGFCVDCSLQEHLSENELVYIYAHRYIKCIFVDFKCLKFLIHYGFEYKAFLGLFRNNLFHFILIYLFEDTVFRWGKTYFFIQTINSMQFEATKHKKSNNSNKDEICVEWLLYLHQSLLMHCIEVAKFQFFANPVTR